jgi:hypothetical protein
MSHAHQLLRGLTYQDGVDRDLKKSGWLVLKGFPLNLAAKLDIPRWHITETCVAYPLWVAGVWKDSLGVSRLEEELRDVSGNRVRQLTILGEMRLQAKWALHHPAITELIEGLRKN